MYYQMYYRPLEKLTVKGETIELRQTTEEEQELATIYSLLDITPHPMGTRKFVGPPKIPPEKSHR